MALGCEKKDTPDIINTDNVYKLPKVTDNKYFVTYTLNNSGSPTGYGFNKTISDFTNVSDGGYELTDYKDANTYTKTLNFSSLKVPTTVSPVYRVSFYTIANCGIGYSTSTCFVMGFSFKELKPQTLTFATAGEEFRIDDFTNNKSYMAGIFGTKIGNLTLTITDVGSIGGLIRGTFNGIVVNGGINDIPISGSFSIHRGE
jgi:hypothetical protein